MEPISPSVVARSKRPSTFQKFDGRANPWSRTVVEHAYREVVLLYDSALLVQPSPKDAVPGLSRSPKWTLRHQEQCCVRASWLRQFHPLGNAVPKQSGELALILQRLIGSRALFSIAFCLPEAYDTSDRIAAHLENMTTPHYAVFRYWRRVSFAGLHVNVFHLRKSWQGHLMARRGRNVNASLHHTHFPSKDGSSAHLVVGNIYLLDSPNSSGSCTDRARRGKEYSSPRISNSIRSWVAKPSIRHFMRHILHLLNKARIGVVKALKSRANNKRGQFHGLPRSHSFLSSDSQQRSCVSSNASPQLCHVSWFYRIQDPP
ncbi:uncharacterized protein FFC1_00709 [Fusarium fujikuroi]|nr:uncharacterized protein FFC1_00709 [Fusarium fujikuroi]